MAIIMKYFPGVLLLSVYCIVANGQAKKCNCENDTTGIGYVNCDTIKLKDGSFMYWQYNCDSAWLTLAKVNKGQIIIDVVKEIPQVTYRIGYNLIKEYKNSLFFTSGCAATGPCDYVIIDKASGKKVKEFSETDYEYLVNNDDMNNSMYKYNFIVYFSRDPGSINVYKIDERKTLTFHFNGAINYPHPEATFKIESVKGNILKLTYLDLKDKVRMVTLHI